MGFTRKRSAGFIDSAEFEKIKKKGDAEVKKWIDSQLKGTSVTVILIGNETCDRKYVKYEVKSSYEKGNKIIGVHIHKLKDLYGKTSTKGSTTFGELGKGSDGNIIYFHNVAKEYDYVDNDGYNNLGKWIENAIK